MENTQNKKFFQRQKLKIKKSFLVLAGFAVVALSIGLIIFPDLKTDAEESGDFTYIVNNGEATITGYLGYDSGTIFIPAYLDIYPVTAIGEWAFSSTLVSRFYIPETITSIASGAFSPNLFLTDFIVEASNPAYSSLNGVLFNKDQTVLIQYPSSKPGSSYSIPSSVINISDFAFDQTALAGITIPNSVTNIGNYAFSYNASLASIVIPESIVSIGNYTFAGCHSLVSITIPSSVASIGDGAFDSCHSLSAAYFLGDAPVVGTSIFSNVSASFKITYLSSKTGWATPTWNTYPTEASDFAYSFSGSNATVVGYAGIGGDVRIPATFGSYSVTGVDSSTFSGQISITSIAIPVNIASIGDSAFADCTALSAAYFLGNSPVIGSNAFSNVSASFKIIYLSSKTGWTTPMWNGYLTEANDFTYTVSGGNATITGYTGTGGPVVIPNIFENIYPVVAIGNNAFQNEDSITEVTIPDGITSISTNAFYSCDSLVSVYIGSGVSGLISGSTFMGELLSSITVSSDNMTYSSENGVLFNKNRTTIYKYPPSKAGDSYVIPNTVTLLEASSFWNTKLLTSITIPDSVTTISQGAFVGSSSMTSITFPASIANIGDQVFWFASSLSSAYFSGNAPTVGASIFSNTAPGFKIYYYENTSGWTTPTWNGYTTEAIAEEDPGDIYSYTVSDNEVTITGYSGAGGNITIPDTLEGYPVTSIGETAFGLIFGCKNPEITGVVIPDSVTSIGSSAFMSCENLTSVNMGSGITIIGSSAFEGTSITNINIPDSVVSIRDSAFYRTSLSTVVIPDGVVDIGVNAFSSIEELTSVFIGSGVTNIGGTVFFGCESLSQINVDNENSFYSSQDGILFDKDKTTIVQYPSAKAGGYVIPDTVVSIGDNSFYGANLLTSIIIPDSVLSMGAGAFSGCTSLTSVSIGSGLTSISSQAFDGCTSLNSIEIPGNITSIGFQAFAYCTNLTNIVLNEGLVSIGVGAFRDGLVRSNIEIPSTVNSIGNFAFSQNLNLVSVFFDGNAPTLGAGAFDDASFEFKIYYVDGKSGWATPIWNGYPADLYSTDFSVDIFNKEVPVVSSTQPLFVTIPMTVTDATFNFTNIINDGSGVLPEINISLNNPVVNAQVSIPAGTVVEGGIGWSGIMNAPQVRDNNSVTITGGTVDSVMEIGFDDVKLTFNKGVRLLFGGKAGERIGYSRNGSFTEITNTCSEDSQSAGNALPAEGDCKIVVGSDLVVWTKHFTSFAVFTPESRSAVSLETPAGEEQANSNSDQEQVVDTSENIEQDNSQQQNDSQEVANISDRKQEAGPGAYDYQYIAQSKGSYNVNPGEDVDVWVEIKNTGTATWFSNGQNPIRLGPGSVYDATSQGHDYASGFSNTSWLYTNRAASIVDSEVASGSNTRFQFKIKAPSINGVYRAYFTPVAEGITWMRDVGIYWEIIVGDIASSQISPISVQPSPGQYEVNAGDSLKSIAGLVYGDREQYAKLIELNKEKFPSLIWNPNIIFSGWVLNY